MDTFINVPMLLRTECQRKFQYITLVGYAPDGSFTCTSAVLAIDSERKEKSHLYVSKVEPLGAEIAQNCCLESSKQQKTVPGGLSPSSFASMIDCTCVHDSASAHTASKLLCDGKTPQSFPS